MKRHQFRNICITCFCILNFMIFGQISFNWAKSLRGELGAKSHGLKVKTDMQGNVYSYGWFINTVDFDPGPGTYSLNSLGFAPYLTKFDAAGNLIWARHFRNPFLISLTTNPSDFAVDNTGNVYCTGRFTDYNDFDPGPATYTLNPVSGGVYVCKLDVNGNFLWAKQLSDSPGNAFTISLDNTGNVIIAGTFESNSNDFDPGPATYSFVNSGDKDVFVCKLSPAGNFIWARQIGGGGLDAVNDLVMTPNNQFVLVGRFAGLADFDPGPGTFTLNSNGGSSYFCTLSANTGSFIGAWQLGNTACSLFRVKQNSNGNLVVLVSFNTIIDADPGLAQLTFTPNGIGNNYYVGDYTTAGSLNWAKHFNVGSLGSIIVNDLDLDFQNRICIGGSYAGVADFDPGPGTHTLTSNSNNNVNSFVLGLLTSGDFSWVREIQGPNYDRLTDLCVAAGGGIFATGEFASSGADFDIGPGVFTMSALDKDAFILGLIACTLPPPPAVNPTTAAVCGVNAITFATISSNSITWRSSLMSNSYLSNSAVYTSSLLPVGTYSFYAAQTNTCGESFPPALVQASVFPMATITAVSNTSLYCYGESITITGNGGINYAVANQFFTSSVVITPLGNVVYTVTGSDQNGCTGSVNILLVMDACTAISENQNTANARVWPNPATDRVSIHLQDLRLIEVFDPMGLLLTSFPTDKDNAEISLTLPEGIYLLRLHAVNGNALEKKLIVQN